MSSLIDGPIDVEPSDSTPDPSPNNVKDGLQAEGMSRSCNNWSINPCQDTILLNTKEEIIKSNDANHLSEKDEK